MVFCLILLYNIEMKKRRKPLQTKEVDLGDFK